MLNVLIITITRLDFKQGQRHMSPSPVFDHKNGIAHNNNLGVKEVYGTDGSRI